MSNIQEKTRNQLIDILKFGLAFLTMLHHYELTFNLSFISFSFIGSEIYFLGVECFYILSGYFEFLKDDQLENNFFVYFIKKVIRIYPMVIISTTFAYIICCIYGTNGLGIINSQFSFSNYLYNVLLIFSNGIFGIEIIGVNNPLWYLSVLLVIYIYIFIVIFISRKLKININYLLLISILLFVFVEYHQISLPFFCGRIARGMIPFCVGGMLVSVNSKYRKCHLNIVSLIGCITMVIIYMIEIPIFIEYKRYIYIFILFPLIVLFCTNSKIISKLFYNPFFNRLGEISFEMYAWHTPIYYVVMVINGFYNILPVNEKWFECILMIFIIVWSELMYRFVEKPISNKLTSILQKNFSIQYKQ